MAQHYIYKTFPLFNISSNNPDTSSSSDGLGALV